MAKRDCCLDYAIQHHLMHSHLGKLRPVIVKAVAEATGIPVLVKDVDGKEVPAESDNTYIKRVAAELEERGEDLEEVAGDAVAEAINAVPVDLTKAVRTAGVAKVAQKWLDMGQKVIDEGKDAGFCEANGITVPADLSEEDYLKFIANEVRKVILAKQKELEAQVAGI